jgi:signal transduction histidine kinase
MALILVVDDVASNREPLVTVLRDAGHRTLEAIDGNEALAVIASAAPDVVITEILMPKMDGYEFVHRLRAQDGIHQPRVVFCTATYHAAQLQELAEACGVSHVLAGPVEPNVILKTLASALDEDAEPAAMRGEEFDRVHLRVVDQKLIEKVAELEAANIERSRLLGDLVNAQEAERARIAADIHDDSIQVMSAAALRFDLLRRSLRSLQDREAIAQVARTVDEAIVRLRRLMFDLRPRSLDSEGLGGAIRAYMAEITKELDFQWRLEDGTRHPLIDNAKVTLYRIAQEAIRNICKHARASRVLIVLTEQDEGALLRIWDDGEGFSQEEAFKYRPGHLGLASMRERAESAGGRLRLESSPGGSSIRAWIPLAVVRPEAGGGQEPPDLRLGERRDREAMSA